MCGFTPQASRKEPKEIIFSLCCINGVHSIFMSDHLLTVAALGAERLNFSPVFLFSVSSTLRRYKLSRAVVFLLESDLHERNSAKGFPLMDFQHTSGLLNTQFSENTYVLDYNQGFKTAVWTVHTVTNFKF